MTTWGAAGPFPRSRYFCGLILFEQAIQWLAEAGLKEGAPRLCRGSPAKTAEMWEEVRKLRFGGPGPEPLFGLLDLTIGAGVG